MKEAGWGCDILMGYITAEGGESLCSHPLGPSRYLIPARREEKIKRAVKNGLSLGISVERRAAQSSRVERRARGATSGSAPQTFMDETTPIAPLAF